MSYPYTASLYEPEHEIFRQSFRRFIETEMEPNVDRWLESHDIEPDWRKAGEAGILGVDIPEQYGGPGGDFLHRLGCPRWKRGSSISCTGSSQEHPRLCG